MSEIEDWPRVEERKCPACEKTDVKFGGWAAQAIGAVVMTGWECECGMKFQAPCPHDRVSKQRMGQFDTGDKVCNYCGAVV